MASAPGALTAKTEVSAWWRVALEAVVWTALYLLIEPLSRWIAYGLFGLPRGSHLGDAVAFFFYDVAKILLLLSGMIFVITVVRSFFSAERARRLLSGKRVGIGNVLAATLGIVTPFCSCSAVPLFIGFVESGIPLGVTFSFLIAAPVINEIALILLFGMFGWKVAALYVSSGLTIAIVTGLVLGRLRLERYVEDFVWRAQFREGHDESAGLAWEDRFGQARDAVRDILKKVWLYVLAGIGVGAGIHGYVPTDALASHMGKDAAWWSVPARRARRPAALLERGGNGAGAPGPRGEGRGARHGTRVHDGRRGCQPSRDDPPAPRAEAATDRRIRRRRDGRHHRHGVSLQPGPMRPRELEAAMPLVTVFRRIPPPIVGTVGVIHDPAFEAFGERLDWLEASGVLVERFDPAVETGEVAARESVRERLATEGDSCLPLILVNDAVVLRGGYPSRTELARAVGRRCPIPSEFGRRLASIGAAAAIGAEHELQRQVALARAIGRCEHSLRLAEETGRRRVPARRGA